MYEVPSRKDIARVVVNEGTILADEEPTIVPREITPRRRRPTTGKRDTA